MNTLPTVFPETVADDYVEVTVTAVCSPDLLYVQLKQNETK